MAFIDIFKKRWRDKEQKSREGKAEEKRPPPKAKEPVVSKKQGAAKPSVLDGEAEAAAKKILRPRLTEKTTALSENGVYTFQVPNKFGKVEIKKTVEKLYGVKVKGVRITKTGSKPRFIRGIKGQKAGIKKAVVTLAKGERIEF